MSRNVSCLLIGSVVLAIGCASGQGKRSVVARKDALATQTLPAEMSDPGAITSLVRQVVHEEPSESPVPPDVIPRAVEEAPAESALSTLLPPPVDVSSTNAALTLEAAIAAAVANSPAVAEARAAAAEAAGIRNQVGLRPNPTLSFRAEEIGADGAAGLHNINLSQTFVRGDKLAWNRAVVDRDVQRLLWDVEAQQVRVRTDVAIRFYDALRASRQIELADRFVSVVEQGVALAEERLDAGEGTRADVLQAEVLLSEVQLRRQQAAVAATTARRRLSVLTNLPLEDAELTGDFRAEGPPKQFETLLASLSSTSPVVLSAQAEVERARRNVSRQQVQPIPNVTGQLGVGQDFGSDNTFANVGVSLPVPIHNRNQGNIAAAHADYCRATQKLARVRQDLSDRLAAALRRYEQAQVSVEFYRDEIVPRAGQSLELIEQAYEVGEVDYLRVLTAREAAFAAEAASIEAEAKVARFAAIIDGYLLTGSLESGIDYTRGDNLRDAALSGL